MQQKQYRFPYSFPNQEESLFLKLILSSDTDFPLLFSQWEQHIIFDDINYATLRLLPLLYLRMQSLKISSQLFGKIQGVYKLIWFKNQQLLHQVRAIDELFNKHGIDVILLKGIPLILETYHDIGARFLGDADILIDPAKTEKAISLLMANGWKLVNPKLPNFSQFSYVSLQRLIREFHFVNKQNIDIEIHWRIFPFSKRDEIYKPVLFEDIFNRSRLINYRGKTYRSMSPEDILLHVIVHGSVSNSHRTLRWVADAVTIIRTHSIHWQQFWGRVEQYGFSVEIFFAFSYLLEHNFISLDEKNIQKLNALKLPKSLLKEYYKNSNGVTRPLELLGRFPWLWHMYWKYESRPSLFKNIAGFFDYLACAFELENKSGLPGYIIDKLLQRFRSLAGKRE